MTVHNNMLSIVKGNRLKKNPQQLRMYVCERLCVCMQNFSRQGNELPSGNFFKYIHLYLRESGRRMKRN